MFGWNRPTKKPHLDKASKSLLGLQGISGCENSSRIGDVIFVHGLGGNAWTTWHPEEKLGDDNFWLNWLWQNEPNIGIWSFGYEAEPSHWKGDAMPLFDQASNLLEWMKIKGMGERSLIFITHSLGGLLVKKTLNTAQTFKKHKLIEQITGIVFLATPRTGSHLANLLNNIGTLARTTVSIEDLKAHVPQLRELNEWYRETVYSLGICTQVYYETKSTQGILVVDPDSANPSIEGVKPIAVPANHITIAKPYKTDLVYLSVERFIREYLKRPEKAVTTRPQISLTAEYPHLIDLAVQVSQLIHPASDAPRFDLRVSLGHSYEDVISGRVFEQSLTPSRVLQCNDLRRILIHAAGGSGKTAIMCAMSEEAVKNGQVVFFLDLKTWSTGETLSESFDIHDLVDSFSVAGSFSDFHKALQTETDVVLLVDGLNEVYGPISETILKIIDKLIRDYRRLRVIVADRMNPHADIRFIRGTVDPLAETEILRLLQGEAKLPEEQAERQLLSIPFFLDLQLQLWKNIGKSSSSPHSVLARAEMFHRYFIESAKLKQADLPPLAEAAFKAYAKYSGRLFEDAWWTEHTPPGVADHLEKVGIVIKTVTAAGGRKSMFRHQLIHDFLVGYYTANLGEEHWGSEVFDKATFKTNAVEPLSFAAELLGIKANDFLIKVFDWSYRSANRCISDLKRSLVDSPVSPDLKFAMMAKNAERLFDVFEDTVTGARRRLIEAKTPEAEALLQSESLADVLNFVREFRPTTYRFKAWKELFLLTTDSLVTERDLLLLNGDPIIGWTAANTFRRVPLSDLHIAQIRMLYHCAMNISNDTLKWRIVHVLGKFPSVDNIELLLQAALYDPYEWTRYGAVRSLMEIASAADANTRENILSRLLSNMENMNSPHTLREIRRTCLVRDARPDWYQTVRALALKAAAMSAAQVEHDAWEELLSELDRRANISL
jgi:predicted alpha/beta hydrolase family esterase